ncbi:MULTISPECIES: DUF6090 family protein [Croceitalea]|uniref:DUF6090 family protein n=1 Tax=Croceitalea vernalis TaxID=3075599 RepID=A0ABU3BD38_9FLAO|nr:MULTISPECIES: DUF6090 family protein [unclassified Croceitalea]MDT0538609.1 DUF6090 family protein [Croceitalea sp. P059]MDT0620394.1 DUF6090 family protein [Croceitalea sp. P007]
MIKFFRKIRQRLLTENKFSKYLVYAIGEIILVVIGILIALQINNWNETSKMKMKSISYLKQFKGDIESDTIRLSQNIDWNEKTLVHIDSIWKNLSKEGDLKNEDKTSFTTYHKRLILETYFVAEKSTYNLFLSSANDIKLDNSELQKELYRYYSFELVTEKNVEQSLQLYQHQHITSSVLENVLTTTEGLQEINITNAGLDLNIEALRKNKEYLANLRLKMRMTSGQNGHYKNKMKMAKKLLASLAKELNQ